MGRICRPGTDTFASNVIGHAVAERMDGLVLPATPFGVTPMHMPFEGTITLTPDTYMRVVTETCVSTAKHGAKRLLILNWHEGNIPSLAIAAEALHREHGMSVLTVQACYVAEELYGHTCNGLTHGGEIEALAVLAYRPDLVHLDRIDYSSDHSHGHRMDKLRRTRSYQPVLTDIRSIAATGWFGSPQHATAEKGDQDARPTSPKPSPGRRPTSSASSIRCRAARPRSSNCGKYVEGGALMARVIKPADAKRLGLPGRVSFEPVSGEIGSRVTCRIAEIPVFEPGDKPRGPHLHDGFEECIYVLKGTGMTVSESGEFPIGPAISSSSPPNEKHMTRNTGTEPLVLVCFFPHPDISPAPPSFPRSRRHLTPSRRRLPTNEEDQMSKVLCLRPEADFARVDALPPSSLAVTYTKPDDPAVPKLIRQARALVIPAVGPKLSPRFVRGRRSRAGAGDGRGPRPPRPADVDPARHSRSPTCPAAAIRRWPNMRSLPPRCCCAASPGRMPRSRKATTPRFAPGWSRTILLGIEGLTVGVIGLGTIGAAVAQAFRRAGCQVELLRSRSARP